jgi:hypothetical protein
MMDTLAYRTTGASGPLCRIKCAPPCPPLDEWKSGQPAKRLCDRAHNAQTERERRRISQLEGLAHGSDRAPRHPLEHACASSAQTAPPSWLKPRDGARVGSNRGCNGWSCSAVSSRSMATKCRQLLIAEAQAWPKNGPCSGTIRSRASTQLRRTCGLCLSVETNVCTGLSSASSSSNQETGAGGLLSSE